jgi:hypothetical protein
MPGPNFFIIGAPKCGTTSLANYLRAHPQVFFPEHKEPHFFNTDMRYMTVRSESHYYALFRSTGPQHTAIGEGSALYLYSDAAVPNILRVVPDAKFIVMIRNPIEMAVSYHAQLRAGAEEDIGDFATAWRLQEERSNGSRIPRFCREPSALLYGRVCSTGWQLKRLYSRVSRDRVLLLLRDDLKRDAKSVYQRTLEFLGVPDDGRTAFPVYNRRQPRMRSQLVQVGIRTLGYLSVGRGIGRRLGIFRLIVRLNSRKAENEVLDPQFVSELRNYFHYDVKELSALVGQDLSGWLEPGALRAIAGEDRMVRNGASGVPGRRWTASQCARGDEGLLP